MSAPASPSAAEALASAAVYGGESPQWAREFPDFPCTPWPEIPAGFADASWHNDVNPSLSDDARELQIFCAEPEPAAREWEGLARYCLCEWGVEAETSFECEEWGELRDVLDDIASGATLADAAMRGRLRCGRLTVADLRKLIAEEEAAEKPTADALESWRRELAEKLAARWAEAIGAGWHPDTPGRMYAPPLGAERVAIYDSDMAELFALTEALGTDPYAIALAALEKAGAI